MALTTDFGAVSLSGLGVVNPTSIQFGPDGRLYVSEQNGTIKVADVAAIIDPATGNIAGYQASNVESIDLITDMPNHDDDGSLNLTLGKRQSTGLVVEEDANGEIAIYVGSSDPRIGGGNKGETGLDTNSSIISRLQKNAQGVWEKVDIVIGLPRSEENHSLNGLDIRTEIVDGEEHKILYAASGGNTNAGAPANNFEWIPEYYYAASILRIDLTQLEQMEADLIANGGLNGGTAYVDPYVYALPTLDDPTRANDANGHDTAVGATDPADAEAASTFGGNDGRNMAKYDPTGPVQVYSMGYRNAYDLVWTQDGNLYTFDNGPNNGWGSKPVTHDNTAVVSSGQVSSNRPNVDVEDGQDFDQDNLHLVTEGLFAGSPNPTYAQGADAGLYTVDDSSGTPIVTRLTDPSDPDNDPTTTEDDLPVDWATVSGIDPSTGGSIKHPEAGVYLSAGQNTDGSNKGPDGSLLTIGSSTNGLTEYTAAVEAGLTDQLNAEVLISASFNGNITFAEIISDATQSGTNVTDVKTITVGGTPLDVTAVGVNGIPGQDSTQFAGTIWIARYGTDDITVLVPGLPPVPDTDLDNDGLDDNVDPLQDDPNNAATVLLNPDGRLYWDFNPSGTGQNPGPSGQYDIGVNGWMNNGVTYLEGLRDLNNTIRGGAPGIIQIKQVTAGSFMGTTNDQLDAMQAGFTLADGVDKFTIQVPVLNPFSSDANDLIAWADDSFMGIALGNGSQSDALFFGVSSGTPNPDGSPNPQLWVYYEENDVTIADFKIDASVLAKVNGTVDDDAIDLFLDVDMATLTVTPKWRYQMSGVWSSLQTLGQSVQLQSGGAIAETLLGNATVNDIDGAPVSVPPTVSLVASSSTYDAFTADFLEMTIATPTVVLQPTNGSTTVSEAGLSDNYSVFLSSPPSADVTVTIAANADVTFGVTELTFTPDNWDVPQLVSINGVDDILNEGDETISVTHSLSSTDPNFNGINKPLSITVLDNDVPGITLTESNGSTSVEEGGATDTYTLVLDTQPTSDVTVTLAPDAQLTVDKTELVFTPQNWNVAQTVTITAVDDATPELEKPFPISHTVTSTDPNYNNQTVPDVQARVVDNDGPLPLYIVQRINVGGKQAVAPDGSIWAEDSGLIPSPYLVGGGENIFNVTSPVDITDPSIPASAQFQSLFQTSRWDQLGGSEMEWAFDVPDGTYEVRLYLAETDDPLSSPGLRVFDVELEGTVPAVWDGIDMTAAVGADTGYMLSHRTEVTDGTLNLNFLHSAASHPNVKGIEIYSVAVPVLPKLSVNDVVVNETDGTATFNVALSSVSSEAITVDFTTVAGTALGGSDYTTTTGSLVFNPGDTSKTITVNLSDDEANELDETFSVVLSNASGAEILDAEGVATILANDVPQVSINDVTVNEKDGTATFSVSLSVPSLSDITVDYATGNGADTATAGADYTAATGSLTFLAGETTKTVTVDITNDIEQEADETFRVQLSNADGAVLGNALGIGTIFDDDTPRVLLLPTDGSTVVSEDGTTDTYSLVLSTQPTDDVTVTLTLDDPSGRVTLSTTQVTFTTDNWDTPQAITLGAIDDQVPGRNTTVSISHSVSSADSDYDTSQGAQDIPDLAVTVVDNDEIPTFILQRINVGGSQVVAPDGSVWSADSGQNLSPYLVAGGQNILSSNDPVELTDPSLPDSAKVQSIFQTSRWDPASGVNMQWAFANVPEGEYEVRLYFAETYNPLSFVGGRIFDVAIEGIIPNELNDVDSVAIAGADKGHMISYFTQVSDGTLNIEFFHVADNPSLKGIEIFSVGSPILPTLSINDVVINEADGTATFTVELSTTTPEIITVDFATANGTALSGSDYSATAGTLSFNPGESSKTITVNINNDSANESDETFSVVLTNASGAAFSDAVGTATILANDVPTLSVNDVVVNEDEGTATFTVSLSAVAASDVTVDYTLGDVTDTATAGDDYTAATGSLTFLQGELSKTITVDITNDIDRESNETFTVELINANGAALGDGLGTGTIVDDDTPKVLLLSSNGSTMVDENGTTDTYSLVLSTQPTDDVTVTLTPSNQVTVDVTTVTFTPANWDVPQAITVTAIDDTTPEGTQPTTISHSASSSDPDYDGQAISDLTVTVADNDPFPTFALHRINVGGDEVVAPDGAIWTADNEASPSPYRVGSGGGKISVSNGAIGLTDPSLPESAEVASIFQSERWDPSFGENMKWEFDVPTGEYEVRLYFAETYDPASVTGGRVFDVAVEGNVPTIFDDIDPFAIAGADNGFMLGYQTSVFDGSLSLEFLHGASQNPILKGIEVLSVGATITPDLTINDVSVNEADGTATFTVSLSNVSQDSITVDFTTVDGTALSGSDYTAATGTLNFAPGELTQTITVALTEDLDNEAAETFTVELSNAVGANLADSSGTATILANDPLPELSIDDVTVNESDGTATFTISLSAASASEVTVNASVADDTATDGEDYSATATTLTFAPGVTTQSFTVDITEDSLQEDSETFTVSLDSPVNAVIADGVGIGTITDNDTPGILLTESDGITDVGEGGPTDSYSFVLVSQPAADVTITLTPSNQLTLDTTQLVFTPANWDQAQTVTITAVDDTAVEGNQLVTIGHTVSSTDANYDGLAISDLSVTVVDNDELPSVVLHRINVGGAQVTAADGSVWSADNEASPSPYRVGVGGNKISVSNVAIDLTNSSLSDSAKVAEIFQTERWDPGSGDNMRWEFAVDSGNYQVNLLFAETYNGTSSNGARVFDVEVEGVVPTVFDNIDQFAIAGEDAGFMLSYSTSVSDGSLSLEFLKGAQNPNLKGIEVLSLDTAVDTTPPIVNQSIAEVILTEKATPQIIGVVYSDVGAGLDLTSFGASDITVTGAVTGVQTITANPQITSNGDGTVLVEYEIAPPGGTWDSAENDSYTVALNANEVFDLAGNAAAANSSLNTFVVDVPEVVPLPDLSITDVVINEADGTASLVVSLSETSDTVVTVDFTTADDTALAGSDYVAQFGTLTFNPGETVQVITVDITDDLDEESDEAFTVELSNASGATILDSSGAVTILANDVPTPLPTLSIGDVTVNEAEGTATFTVSLSTASTDPITVDFATADDTALAGSDYTANSGTLTFAAGETTQTITVDITDDTAEELDEAFTVELSNASGATIQDGIGTATILANDVPTPLPTLSIGDVTVNEAEGAATFTVSLSTASTDPITVDFATADDTALAGSDYTANSGTLTFAAGETTQTITVDITDDTAEELDEAFTVELSNASGATIQDGIGTATILANDAPTPDLAIDDITVNEGDGTATFTVSLSSAAVGTVTVDFTTLDGTALAGSDYATNTGTLTFNPGETTKSIVVSLTNDKIAEAGETFTVELSNASGANLVDATGSATVADNDTLDYLFNSIIPVDSVDASQNGSIRVSVTTVNNVQVSTYTEDRIVIENTGDKRVSAIYFDITDSLFEDNVIDPQGLAGDSVARGIFFGASGTGGTGVNQPVSDPDDPAVNEPFYGLGGIDGYEGMFLTFDPVIDNGFNNGEQISFGVDVDPNSIVGLPQDPVDINGDDPRLQVNGKGWDIGGVSGAELIGSKIHVLFTDGTTAVSELASNDQQGGAIAVVDQASPNKTASLTVNGLADGGVGTYNQNNLQVLVSGNVGDTVRVSMVKGFVQPFTYTDPNGNFVDLSTKFDATSPFVANNAIQFQTFDVTLTATQQDITSLFDLTAPGGIFPDFEGNDQLPLGFFANVVDATTGDPLGEVTEPIFLKYEGKFVNIQATQNADEAGTNGIFTVSLTQAAAVDTVITYTVAGTARPNGTNTPGADYQALSGQVTIAAGQTSATIDVNVLDDPYDEAATESVKVTLGSITSGDPGTEFGSSTTATVTIADDDVNTTSAAGLIATEIMYDPNSEYNGDYAWIELYNPGTTAVDLSNYVFLTQTGLQAAGTRAGVVPEGTVVEANSTAVLYGSVVRNPNVDWGTGALDPLPDMWDTDPANPINLVPVFFYESTINHTPYVALKLDGSAVEFGLWNPNDYSLEGNYWNNPLNFATAEYSFAFEKGDVPNTLFPTSNNSSSIYLKDVSLDPTDGSNWALSTPDVDGAYTVNANIISQFGEVPGPYGTVDVGSPGYVPGVVPVSTDPVAPIISTFNASSAVLENTTFAVDVLAQDGNGDSEGNGLTYSLTGGLDQSLFTIDANTGVVNFITAPDFEAPSDSDGNNLYEFEVTVTDSTALTDVQLFSVTITNDTSEGVIRREAETADSITNYRVENNTAASNGQVVGLNGGQNNETGSATFLLGTEANGTYNILVGAFDENDGIAQFSLKHIDFETGVETSFPAVSMDQNLGSSGPVAQTFVTSTLASGVSLTPGDSLIVTGVENVGDKARLDYLELLPSI